MTEEDAEVLREILGRTPPPTREELREKYPELFDWKEEDVAVTIGSSSPHDPEQMKHLAEKTGDKIVAKDANGTKTYDPPKK
jgi:hypothetical protein